MVNKLVYISCGTETAIHYVALRSVAVRNGGKRALRSAIRVTDPGGGMSSHRRPTSAPAMD